jgi:hypothetical protein
MCFERIRVAGWRPRANEFVRDSRGIGGKPHCFGFVERCEQGVAGGEIGCWGEEGEHKTHWSGTVLAR